MSSPFYIGRSGGIALEGAISSAMFVTPSIALCVCVDSFLVCHQDTSLEQRLMP
jgi:hypothetical protein